MDDTMVSSHLLTINRGDSHILDYYMYMFIHNKHPGGCNCVSHPHILFETRVVIAKLPFPSVWVPLHLIVCS